MLAPRSQHYSSTEPGSTSPAARKGLLGHPGVLLIAGILVIFGAYALGYLPQFGSLLEDAIRSSRSSEFPVLSPAFYGIAGLASFLILLGLLRSFDIFIRKLRDISPLKTRPAKSVEKFIEEAAKVMIGLRVAREGYNLLEPQYPHKMCIDLSDNLRSDLRLPDEAILALDALLRTRCDRRQAPIGAATGTSTEGLVTVFDLLQVVESAPPLREDRSGSRDRVTDITDPTPSRRRRLSESAERKALHAATLSAIETGSLHSPESSGLHRRFSDYSGPRRRATDNRQEAEFTGPYQRSTDRPALSSPERNAQPATDLTRRAPSYVPPRNKRIPESTR